jgi:hypothetical protein
LPVARPAPIGGAGQRRDPPFEQVKLLAKFEIFLQQLLASGER